MTILTVQDTPLPSESDVRPSGYASEKFSPYFSVNAEWLEFNENLTTSLAKLEKPLLSQASFLQTSKGKQLRPLLVFACCSLLAPPNHSTMKAALAAELIHLASLVHDDIIDNSHMRRGNPTLNHLNGPYVSVLIGDSIFAEAFKILANQHMLEILEYYVQAIQDMCLGEIQQDLHKFASSRTIPDYLEQISQKTGSLLSACCKAGVQTAYGSENQLLAAAEFGKNLGIAFQITDDIKDCTSNEKVLGKPPGNDLTEGNLTLPLLLLLQEPLYGPWFQALLSQKALSPVTVHQILKAIEESGVLSQAKQQAVHYVSQANQDLLAFPDTPIREFLAHQANSLLTWSN